jgi:hypothetical protein
VPPDIQKQPQPPIGALARISLNVADASKVLAGFCCAITAEGAVTTSISYASFSKGSPFWPLGKNYPDNSPEG